MTSSPRTVSLVGLPPLQPLSPFPFCPSLGFLGRRLMPRRVSLGAAAGRFAGHAGRRWSCPSRAGMAGRVPLRRLLSMSGHLRAMKVGDGISSVVFVVLAQMVASQHPSPYGRGTDLMRHWTRLALAPPNTKLKIAPGLFRARLCLRILWIVACYCRLLGICPAIVQQNGSNPADKLLIDTIFMFAICLY